MTEAMGRLKALEMKHKLFKQQQFIFLAALGRSRELAHDRTEPVSSVAQVQGYKDAHCSNTTDRRIFSLFLEIVAELRAVLEQLASSAHTPEGGGVLDSCRVLLSPNCDISKLQAHFPHDEVNRLSCDEARNYYGGVVSLIPLTLDLLNRLSDTRYSSNLKPSGTPDPSHLQNRDKNQDKKQNQDKNQERDRGACGAGAGAALSSSQARDAPQGSKARRAGGGVWHAGKPAWRPPGQNHL